MRHAWLYFVLVVLSICSFAQTKAGGTPQSAPAPAARVDLPNSDKPSPPQLSGTVVDTSGAVIAGATVQVRSANGIVRITSQSDPHGAFVISGLSAGNYRLVVSNPGFETKELAVSIETAETLPALRISLAVGSVSTTMNVQGREDEPHRNCQFRHPGDSGLNGNPRASDSSFGRSFGDGSRCDHHATRRRR